ncbi:MAG TPA: 50S ribosomal protein L9 [Rickettsiales bacterium]|nr:50S ribosomal protein L9 [Rickettsiales bacterium]
MEVILLERVGRLGTVGDVVKVKDGYGRNFLLPQKKAMRATKDSKAIFEAKRAEIEAANAATRKEAEKKAEKLKDLSVKIVRQASEDGKLYGSVTVRDIAEAVQADGHAVERKQLVLTATIKNTGIYSAKIVLHPEVEVPLKVLVVRNESDVIEEAVPAEEPTAA